MAYGDDYVIGKNYERQWYCPECCVLQVSPRIPTRRLMINCVGCVRPLRAKLYNEGLPIMAAKLICELRSGPDQWNTVNSFTRLPDEFRTSTVVEMARFMAVNYRSDLAPILADALQDSGFNDSKFLGVLRSKNSIYCTALYVAVAHEKVSRNYYALCRNVEKYRDWARCLVTCGMGDVREVAGHFLAITEEGADLGAIWARDLDIVKKYNLWWTQKPHSIPQ